MMQMFKLFKSINKTQQHILTVFMGVALLSMTANISIPLTPVPFTLQFLGILFLGLSFSSKAAIHSILSYVTLGAAGLPILSNAQGGLHKVFGPTGGYLLGFVVTVYALSKIKEAYHVTSMMGLFALCLLGMALTYIFGAAWLSFLLGSFSKAFTVGVMPFIALDLVKAVIITLTLGQLKKHA